MRLRGRVAAITALAVTLAQVVVLAHEAESRHRWCEEHGVSEELVVVHDQGKYAHLDGSVTEARTRAVADHEACAVGAASVHGLDAATHVATERALDALPDAQAPPTRAPSLTAALYRLAPKTSPPIA